MNDAMNPNNAVRPASRTPHFGLAAFLAGIRKLVGGDRFENLYQAVLSALASIDPQPKTLLDYGCGSMDFSVRLKATGVIHEFLAMDTYPAPEDAAMSDVWKHYRQINNLLFSDITQEFDAAIVIDVLHHADENKQAEILTAIARQARWVIVKDHFEYGTFSRQMLRLADWFGNFAYGVRIPDRYFNRQRWSSLVAGAGLREVALINNVPVHTGIFGVLLPSRHHFISILELGHHEHGTPHSAQ